MKPVDVDLLNQAIRQLTGYGPGSSRGALLPIDEAVRAAVGDRAASERMEQTLLEAMNRASTLGQVYLMTQLTLIGGERTASRLAPLLHDLHLSDSSRRTLEALPSAAAAQVLREELPHLVGAYRIGAILSLGRIRHPGSVRILARCLSDPDPAVVRAAVAALGRIASPRAGAVLLGYLRDLPDRPGPEAVEAITECMERLDKSGHARRAGQLREVLELKGVTVETPTVG